MNFRCSSFRESLSQESPQRPPNTTENDPSLNLSRTDKLEEFRTILNFSQAFWNLPADDSTKAENVQDSRINGDETLSSCNDRDMDEIIECDKALRHLYRISARRRLEDPSGSRRLAESMISDQSKIGYLFENLLWILMTLGPVSALAVEIPLFFKMPASFDILSKNYCSRSFYFYAAFFNIFTFAAFIIGGLVKLACSVAHVSPLFRYPEDIFKF